LNSAFFGKKQAGNPKLPPGRTTKVSSDNPFLGLIGLSPPGTVGKKSKMIVKTSFIRQLTIDEDDLDNLSLQTSDFSSSDDSVILRPKH